jgi:hypothetical protein
MAGDQRRRLALLRLRTMLHQLQTEEAAAYTSKLLAEPTSPAVDLIAATWIETLERIVQTDERVMARTMADRAALLFNGKLEDKLRVRLGEVRKLIPGPATTPTTPPAPTTITPTPDPAATPTATTTP